MQKKDANIKTIPAFKPIPSDNATPDTTPEKVCGPQKSEKDKKVLWDDFSFKKMLLKYHNVNKFGFNEMEPFITLVQRSLKDLHGTFRLLKNSFIVIYIKP